MKIHVPQDLGTKLRVLPEDTYKAIVSDIFIGLAKSSGQPKMTVKWTVQSECSIEKIRKAKDYQSTVGENVLDEYSLQEQALWRLNDTYLELTGDRLPEGEYNEEQFKDILKKSLVGLAGSIRLETDTTNQGNKRSVVKEVSGKA